ncbi:MAG: trypsin-like peptidase domain-containing protein [Verrucomicrobiota bacterium]
MMPLRAWMLLLAFAVRLPSGAADDLPRSLERFDFRQVVKEGKNRVFPAVVFIKCVREDLQRGEKQSQEVSGSGVAISADGEILSNWHVVDKAREVRCLLYDGRAFPARVLGADKDTDVALLRLDLPAGAAPVPFARLGESTRLEEGDFVMAMGAPWGMSRSVSIGIISCTRRYLPGSSEYSTWLQTDAPISPGNSGGPLVNIAGEVVGLNTRTMMSGGDMGFTVPIEVARAVADQVRRQGRMDWSWTGLQLQPLKDFNRNVYFPHETGVMVADTDPESPARRAGVQAGDRLLRVNGEAVVGLTQEDLPGINRRLGFLPKVEAARLELVRGGQAVAVQLTPRSKGRVEGEQLDCPRWDFSVKAINQFDNPDLHFHRPEGVFIYGVKFPGNAATAGLSAQDILLKIDGREVRTLADVKTVHEGALGSLPDKHRVLVSLLRNGELRQLVLDFSRDNSRQ